MDLEYKTVKNREMYTHMCLKHILAKMDLEYKTVKNREMYTHMCLKDILANMVPVFSHVF